MLNPYSEPMEKAQAEAYEFFEKNVRSPIGDLYDNDVDAFRHAYVSGFFTQDYGEWTADILGQLNELSPADIYSNSRNPGSKNMDLWNNAIGRKYGKKAKSRQELLKMIHAALKKGELIVSPSDTRNYKAKASGKSAAKPVVVVFEENGGRNRVFFDTKKRAYMAQAEFIAQIQAGSYSGYTVKQIRGIATPVSKPDGRRTNNLT